MKTKPNWKTNGKAFFASFSAGRAVIGDIMVGQIPTGEWISGSKLLGQSQFPQGYFALKAETPKFPTRVEAEADAVKLAEKSIARQFEMQQYLFDLDKKSPWKNTPAPVASNLEFHS